MGVPNGGDKAGLGCNSTHYIILFTDVMYADYKSRSIVAGVGRDGTSVQDRTYYLDYGGWLGELM